MTNYRSPWRKYRLQHNEDSDHRTILRCATPSLIKSPFSLAPEKQFRIEVRAFTWFLLCFPSQLMGLWCKPKGAQVSPHPVHLPLKDQEARRGHGLYGPQEARIGNEAAMKVSCSTESQAGLAFGRTERGDCRTLWLGEDGEFPWREYVSLPGLP